MPLSVRCINKVGVPNAYINLLAPPVNKPLRPSGEGELEAQVAVGYFIWYTLGFHHLGNSLVQCVSRSLVTKVTLTYSKLGRMKSEKELIEARDFYVHA